jgi:hypothetical protein
MCTVTYIPPSENQGFILTTNRDEKMFRKTKAPEIYRINGIDICFPKDVEKGGSWVAANNQGRLCCLLNGAFIPHQKQAFHTHSRGKVLLDMTAFKGKVQDFFENQSLSNTEPFTIISIEHKKEKNIEMIEFIWDGEQKHISKLNPKKPGIWSSVTLYSDKDRNQRKNWFDQFLEENKTSVDSKMIYAFHSGYHTADQTLNLLMQREGGLKTVSITQVVPAENGFNMTYIDLLKSTKHQVKV